MTKTQTEMQFTTFKKGDRVTLGNDLAAVGTVEDIHDNEDGSIRVDILWDKGDDISTGWDPEQIKFVEDLTFYDRLIAVWETIDLGMNCTLILGHDSSNKPGRYYFQIKCWRPDAFTGEMGYGFGGKAYLSPFQTKSELIQTAFGLYKGYWEHEARETFKYRGRRVFGPHMDIDAVWETSNKIDIRSAKHEADKER